MNIFKFGLGQMVQDIVTKYKGVIMARTEYMTGCNRYGILRRNLKETEGIPEWEWLDENRLTVIENAKVVELKKDEDKEMDLGGGMNAPTR